jgi:hypothetical protein
MCFALWHGVAMKSSVLIKIGIKIGVATAICLVGTNPSGPPRGSASAAQPDSWGGAVVKVVRATKECFSDTLHITGILVPRREAVVVLDEGSRVTEFWPRKAIR